jgi:hypothetical protein
MQLLSQNKFLRAQAVWMDYVASMASQSDGNLRKVAFAAHIHQELTQRR